MTGGRHRPSRWHGAVVGLVAMLGVGVMLLVVAAVDRSRDEATAAGTSAAATPASPAAVTSRPALLSPEPVEVPSTVLAVQTCARIADEPTSAGVWDAAAALEAEPLALSEEAAWAAVSTFVLLDCPDLDAVVQATIAEVTG